MTVGMRIIYNLETGKVLNNSLYEIYGETAHDIRPEQIGILDLPYGYNENNFKDALEYQIDVSKSESSPLSERIIITEYINREQTPEEKVQELENQLLLIENEKVGGIL